MLLLNISFADAVRGILSIVIIYLIVSKWIINKKKRQSEQPAGKVSFNKKKRKNYVPNASFYEAGSSLRPKKRFIRDGVICLLHGCICFCVLIPMIIGGAFDDDPDYFVLGILLYLFLVLGMPFFLIGLRRCLYISDFLSIDSQGIRAYVRDKPVGNFWHCIMPTPRTYHNIRWEQIDAATVQDEHCDIRMLTLYSRKSSDVPLARFDISVFDSNQDIVEIINYYYAIANNEAPGEHVLI